MPAVWQVQNVKPTLFSKIVWDGCETKRKADYVRHQIAPSMMAECEAFFPTAAASRKSG